MWDPVAYLAYAEERGRPFTDLMARVGAREPRRVVDLGCGPGNLTETLTGRWPRAVVEAWDSSADMVAAARARGVSAQVGDLREVTLAPDTDVVVSNATLQWVPEHPELLVSWARRLAAGAWIAFQVPGNFDAASHRCVRDLSASARWSPQLSGLDLRAADAVLSPSQYAGLLADAGCRVDAWESTYVHVLAGVDPVLEWISATALRPIRAALPDAQWDRFRAELAPLLAAAYPPRGDGTTLFGFRRIFAVAQVQR